MEVQVPFSGLKTGNFYIVPPPSDRARFRTATFAHDADEYLDQQQFLLSRYAGRKMQLVANPGAWQALLYGKGGEDGEDDESPEMIYFDETSFPPGQQFQKVPWNWKPSEVAPLPPDPWDEFIDPLDMDFASKAEEEEYYNKNPPVKLTDVLSHADIAAQEQFESTLTPAERRALSAYKAEWSGFMGPLIAEMPEHSRGAVNFARAETRADSKDPDRPPLPKERPGLGVIPDLMTGFLSVVSRAPKLTQEINVFRGVSGEGGLNIHGKLPMSTSYDKHVAYRFSRGKGACCMLKMNVKPGVRIFSWGEDVEREIMILPPYRARTEDVEHSNGHIKQVTLTPIARYRGGTRSRRRKTRRTRRNTRGL